MLFLIRILALWRQRPLHFQLHLELWMLGSREHQGVGDIWTWLRLDVAMRPSWKVMWCLQAGRVQNRFCPWPSAQKAARLQWRMIQIDSMQKSWLRSTGWRKGTCFANIVWTGNLFPARAGLVTAALVGSFDASSAVFVALSCLGSAAVWWSCCHGKMHMLNICHTLSHNITAFDLGQHTNRSPNVLRRSPSTRVQLWLKLSIAPVNQPQRGMTLSKSCDALPLHIRSRQHPG